MVQALRQADVVELRSLVKLCVVRSQCVGKA